MCCGETGPGLCRPCTGSLPAAPDLAPPPGFEECWSLLRYEGAAKDVIGALKFRRHHDAVDLLGAAMARLVDREVDTVTWAPTSMARRRHRGFDQSELLARTVARSLGRPCHRLLARTTTATQTGQDRTARLSGPGFRRRGTAEGTIVVVDDVRTTGATLCAAAEALSGEAAPTLLALTLAVRP